jgi:predicted site-specific integrase-resolvase
MKSTAPLTIAQSSGIPAAAYARMSTDHQRYSIDNQLDAIHRYAGANFIEVVRVYTDAGKSGLRIKNRDGLKNSFRTLFQATSILKCFLSTM